MIVAADWQGGVVAVNGCAPKKIFIHPEGARHAINSADGCMQLIFTQEMLEEVTIQEGEVVDVFWHYAGINDGRIKFENIVWGDGKPVLIMQSAEDVSTSPQVDFIHYRMIRINDHVFLYFVDFYGVPM